MNLKKSEFSFFDHWDELRSRLIKSLLAIGFFSLLFYPFSGKVLAFIIRPVGKVFFTAPTDAFVTQITLTLWGGLILSLPIVFYQIWAFVSLGLKANEKKYLLVFAPFSLILFLLGACFAYFVMVPISLQFLLGFSSDLIQPMITIKNYISFMGSLVLGCGVTFELPLILMFLTKIGIATPEFLSQKRKHAIIIILIISAIVTPPDAVSQMIMAVPLMLLYEVGVWLSKQTQRAKTIKGDV